MKTVFTTGDVAKIAHVAPRTVSKWCDTGRLKHYKVPGSKDRRIPRDALTQFFKEEGWDHIKLAGEPLVLLATPDEMLINHFIAGLAEDRHVKLSLARNLFEAGLSISNEVQNLVVIDAIFAPGQVRALCEKVREKNEEAYIVGLIHAPGMLPRALVNEKWLHPFDPLLFVERVRTLVRALRGEPHY